MLWKYLGGGGIPLGCNLLTSRSGSPADAAAVENLHFSI